MIHSFRSIDHPEANGRKPRAGEQLWSLTFPHENGDDYIEIEIGARGRAALLHMLEQEEIMIKTNERLPEPGKRILVFDTEMKQWQIAVLENRLNRQFWVVHPKMFYPVDFNRFPHWCELPEVPNA